MLFTPNVCVSRREQQRSKANADVMGEWTLSNYYYIMWTFANELLVNVDDTLTVNEIKALNPLQWCGSPPE